jgi:hypothetical protein
LSCLREREIYNLIRRGQINRPLIMQEAVGGSALSSIRLLAGSVRADTATSILELLDKQEASIQQTISENLASISETDKSRSNITAEVTDKKLLPVV